MNGHVAMDINTFSVPPRQFEIQNWLLGRGHVVERTSDHGQSGERLRNRKSSHGGKKWHSVDLGQSLRRKNGKQLSQGQQRNSHHRHTWAHQSAAEEHELSPDNGVHVDVGVEERVEIKESSKRKQKQRHVSLLLDVPLHVVEWGRDSSCSIRPGDSLPGSNLLLSNSPLLTSTSSNFPSTTATSSKRSSTLSSTSTSTSTSIFSSASTLPFPPPTTCPSTSSAQPFLNHSQPPTILHRPNTAFSFKSLPSSFPCSATTMADPLKATKASKALRVSLPASKFFLPSCDNSPTTTRYNLHSLPPSVLTDNLAAASTSFQQVPQDRQNQRELKTSAIPQYRPYGSLGQDGRYQNGEFLSGPRSQPNQTNSQGLQAARSNQANLGQHSQKNLTGQSSRDGGPTAQNQQKQEIPDFNDNGEREPDPGFLASCDYHSFLNDTANTQTSLTPSSTVVTQAKTTTSQQLVDADVDCRDFGAASTAIKDRFAKESRSVLKKTKFPFKTL